MPKFSKLLRLGKYSRWYKNIDDDGIRQHLVSIGKLGAALAALDNSVRTRFLIPETHSLVSVERQLLGVTLLFSVFERGIITLGMPSKWHLDFPRDQHAFRDEKRNELSENTHTKWATNISLRTFALVIWHTSEFGVRISPQSFEEGSFWSLIGAGPELSQNYAINEALMSILNVYWNQE